MLIRCKTPLRISFAGGGTDVSPYFEERGGVVLNATIDKYCYGSLVQRDDGNITVQSLDYDIVAKYHVDEEIAYDGQLDLVKAAIKIMGQYPDNGNGQNTFGGGQGIDLFIHTDAPPGSGLGSSSALVVALIGLLRRWRHLPLTHYDVAELAYHIERTELGIPGGTQDQYAAAFGGFNFMEFSSAGVVVNPLRIDAETINELEYNLLLCYTGSTRLSANILDNQIDNYRNRKVDVLEAMGELKSITWDMKKALLQGRLDDFGHLLHEAWINKKKMAKEITNPAIDVLYSASRRYGALGGKLLGAGGGGYLLIYCPFGKKHVIAAALEELGGQVVEFTFQNRGVQTWEVRSTGSSLLEGAWCANGQTNGALPSRCVVA